MGKKTLIKILENIAIFKVDLHGKKESENTKFVCYNIATSDSSTALDLAKEMAKREGYVDVELVIKPNILFQGSLNISSKYLESISKTPIV